MNKVTLEKKIRKARLAYYNHDPVLSDSEFDALVEDLARRFPESAVLKEVGAAPLGSTGKHKMPMGSLRKAGSPEAAFAQLDGLLVLMDKLDGCSVALDYEKGELVRALTRGNGKEGEVITTNVRLMGNVKATLPVKLTGTLRGEVILGKSIFNEHFADDYANPRNTASGIMRRYSGVGCEFLSVIYFDLTNSKKFTHHSGVLNHIEFKLGLQTVDFAFIETPEQLEEAWADIERDRHKGDFEKDGGVLRIDSLKAKAVNPLLPKHSVALKFAPEMAKTFVQKIEWEAGRTGRVHPRITVYPVKVAGVTVTHATGNNFGWLENLGVGVGAKVVISRRGDVIPAIEKVIAKGKTLVKPKACTTCGSALVEDGAFLLCIDFDCPAKTQGIIERWLKLVDTKGIGPGAIVDLTHFTVGMTTPADLYHWPEEEWQRRFGRNGAKMYKELHAKKTVPLEYLFASFVPNVGRSRFKLLMQAGYNTLPKILKLTAKQIKVVNGVAAFADHIVEHLKIRRDAITQLALVVKLKEPEEVGGALAGHGYKFTGSMKNKRKELETMAEAAGAEATWRRGLKCTLVIADVNSTSSKAQAARKKGYEIISEEDFLQRVS